MMYSAPYSTRFDILLIILQVTEFEGGRSESRTKTMYLESSGVSRGSWVHASSSAVVSLLDAQRGMDIVGMAGSPAFQLKGSGSDDPLTLYEAVVWMACVSALMILATLATPFPTLGDPEVHKPSASVNVSKARQKLFRSDTHIPCSLLK